jgi:hypothetical protein
MQIQHALDDQQSEAPAPTLAVRTEWPPEKPFAKFRWDAGTRIGCVALRVQE